MKVLNWLGRTELDVAHLCEIARVLCALVRDEGKPYIIGLLPRANSVASCLWRAIDRNEQAERSDDWLDLAINRPGGILSEFWMKSLSLWRMASGPRMQWTQRRVSAGIVGHSRRPIVSRQARTNHIGKSVRVSAGER